MLPRETPAARQTAAPRRASLCRSARRESRSLLSRSGSQHLISTPPLVSSQRLLADQVAALYDVTEEHEKSGKQQHEWTKPEQVSGRRDLWTIKNELAIALGQKRDNLLVALAGFHLFANLTAQIFSEISA